MGVDVSVMFFHCDENLATHSLREEGFILGQRGSFSHGKDDRTPVREAMAGGAEGQMGHTVYPVRKKRSIKKEIVLSPLFLFIPVQDLNNIYGGCEMSLA